MAGQPHNRINRPIMAWLGAGLIGLVAMASCQARAEAVPDNQAAVIEVRGSGVSPKSHVTLSTGKKQSLTVEADKRGNFVFSGLQYFSFVPLNFKIMLPDQSDDTISVSRSILDISLDPYGSQVSISGKITPAGSIAVNVDGVEASSQIAGMSGDILLLARTPLGLKDGTSSITANIINVGEACCPKISVPVTPVQLSISSMALPLTPAPQQQKKFTPNGNAPARQVIPYTNPGVILPGDKSPSPQQEEKKDQPKQSPAPYMVLGSVDQEIVLALPLRSAASISYPSSKYDATWVGSMKKTGDALRNSIMTHALMIGAFLDGRSVNASITTLGKLNAQAMRDYQPSDTICKFGTLSRSVAGSESLSEANKKVFSKIFLDRNVQGYNTLFSEATIGQVRYMDDFKGKYCEGVDNNNGLSGYCNSIKNPADLFYNRDVDYTRVMDAPLTLDVNYTDNTLTGEEEKVIALFQNLSLRDPEYGVDNAQGMKQQEKSDDFQDMHQNMAVRMLVGNTFANMVGMKAKGTNESSTYMKNVLVKLGLDSNEAKKLIGDNPSYYAQMEILTKKLYQDPAFYANLYDTPANVDRQKVAMLAVSLMQERDLLESLRRKEMLLSSFLEMKLRREGQKGNQASAAAD